MAKSRKAKGNAKAKSKTRKAKAHVKAKRAKRVAKKLTTRKKGKLLIHKAEMPPPPPVEEVGAPTEAVTPDPETVSGLEPTEEQEILNALTEEEGREEEDNDDGGRYDTPR